MMGGGGFRWAYTVNAAVLDQHHYCSSATKCFTQVRRINTYSEEVCG